MKTAEFKKIRTYIDNLERHVDRYYSAGSAERLHLSADSIEKAFRDINSLLEEVIDRNERVGHHYDNRGQLLMTLQERHHT